MNENKTNINWYPGHMAKTKREIMEKISLIDLVFEVIDARIPYSSKNMEIENMINNKPRILIMSKSDLCDDVITNKWKMYYENKGYKVLLIDLVHDTNLKDLNNMINTCVKDINEKRINKGLKPRKIRVLVLGIPNVGKSTLINRLVKRRATNVGNKPGITKSLEWIRINDSLELLDTPGILWPKLNDKEVALNLASMTAIPEEILNKEEVAIYIINKLLEDYRDNIINRYSINNTSDIVSILDNIGKHIGAIRGEEVDYDKVYNTILKDLREGYLGKVTFDRYED